MFPAVYCGTTFGIANVCARFGGIVAPLVSEMLKETNRRKREDNLETIHNLSAIEEEETGDKDRKRR